MKTVIVLPSALKHGLSEDSLKEAWENYIAKRPRGDDCWVVIGFDMAGREIEMVGLVTIDLNILVIHGLSPATEKLKKELGLER